MRPRRSSARSSSSCRTRRSTSAWAAGSPRACCCSGPPGCGKTLLARAVAGEANVPFFFMAARSSSRCSWAWAPHACASCSSRRRRRRRRSCSWTRSTRSARAAPAPVGAGFGAHDEREQTLNQLLVEMDGFDASKGVIIMAATNRPDVLDPALVRPGRFDRQVVVDRPDLQGSRGDPARARPRRGPGPQRRAAHDRRSHPRLHRRRPGERGERGRAAGRSPREERRHDGRARRGDRPVLDGPGAQVPRDEPEGEAPRRLPRDGARAGRPLLARTSTRCTASRSSRAAPPRWVSP